MSEDQSDGLPCQEKLTFDTKKQAQDTATTAAYQHGTKLKPYQCQHCRLWHLASDYSGTSS